MKSNPWILIWQQQIATNCIDTDMGIVENNFYTPKIPNKRLESKQISQSNRVVTDAVKLFISKGKSKPRNKRCCYRCGNIVANNCTAEYWDWWNCNRIQFHLFTWTCNWKLLSLTSLYFTNYNWPSRIYSQARNIHATSSLYWNHPIHHFVCSALFNYEFKFQVQSMIIIFAILMELAWSLSISFWDIAGF